MPCYSRVQSTVEFGVKTDPKLLGKALQDLGYNVVITADQVRFYHRTFDGVLKNGKLSLNHDGSLDVDATRNAIARGYSTQVVKSAAQRFGWTTKQTADNTFQVTRRI